MAKLAERWRVRPWWFWVLLGVLFSPCILGLGGYVWLSRPLPLMLPQATPAAVHWAAGLPDETALAWLFAETREGPPIVEVWLPGAGPDLDLPLPPEAMLLGGYRWQAPRVQATVAWVRLPARQTALEALHRNLEAQGWSVPRRYRFGRRLEALFRGRATRSGPGFAPPPAAAPMLTERVYCRGPFEVLEARWLRTPQGLQVTLTRYQGRFEPKTMMCSWDELVALFPLLFGEGPERGAQPVLTFPQGTQVVFTHFVGTSLGWWVSTARFQPPASYDQEALQRHYQALLEGQGWTRETVQAEPGLWHATWQRRTWRGTWRSTVLLVQEGPRTWMGWMLLVPPRRGPVEPPRPPSPEARWQVHGRATGPNVQRWLEAYWNMQMTRFNPWRQVLADPKAAGFPWPLPPGWTPVGSLRRLPRPEAPPALEEWVLMAQAPEAAAEDALTAWSQAVKQAGWQVQMEDRGEAGLQTSPENPPRLVACNPDWMADLAFWPMPEGGVLLRARLNPAEGPGCPPMPPRPFLEPQRLPRLTLPKTTAQETLWEDPRTGQGVLVWGASPAELAADLARQLQAQGWRQVGGRAYPRLGGWGRWQGPEAAALLLHVWQLQDVVLVHLIPQGGTAGEG